MDEFQRKRIAELSKKELELELAKIEKCGNPHELDKKYVLKLLKGKKDRERIRLKEQEEFIKKVPGKLLKENVFLRHCKKQILKDKKPLGDNMFRLVKEEIKKRR